MKSAVNSIVCTTSNNLLMEMFNVTPSTERQVTFPPRQCRAAAARCDLCLEQDECLLTGKSLFVFLEDLLFPPVTLAVWRVFVLFHVVLFGVVGW